MVVPAKAVSCSVPNPWIAPTNDGRRWFTQEFSSFTTVTEDLRAPNEGRRRTVTGVTNAKSVSLFILRLRIWPFSHRPKGLPIGCIPPCPDPLEQYKYPRFASFKCIHTHNYYNHVWTR